ncbi:MAG: PIG-L family deacetylase [Thermoguttaceae bacterium]
MNSRAEVVEIEREKKMPTNALVVVAHHDDAILWMGGTIRRLRDWNWRIVSMCVPDPVNREYLQQTCDALGVKSSPFTFADYQRDAAFARNDREQMNAALLRAVGDEKFDWVFTHNPDEFGEYAFHANHSETVQVATALVQGGRLTTGMDRVAFFSYRLIYGRSRATVARLEATHYLQLTYDELLFKCQWTMRAPDAETNLKNIRYPCPNPEAFVGDGLQLPDPFIPR